MRRAGDVVFVARDNGTGGCSLIRTVSSRGSRTGFGRHAGHHPPDVQVPGVTGAVVADEGTQ